MIDYNKWIGSLPKGNTTKDKVQVKLDPEIWTKTLPKIKKNNSFTKYSLLTIIFIIGLISVSVIKNETRSLQKELDNLQASLNSLKLELHQTILDHVVITSPENISKLAKEHLELDLIVYKKNQIMHLNENEKTYTNLNKKQTKSNLNKKSEKLIEKIKLHVATKTKLKKVQELYSKPEELPDKIKLQVTKKIKKTRTNIKNFYDDPIGSIDRQKIQSWAGLQVVKVFLGIPIVPGK